MSLEPHIAAAKVIAAGAMSDDWLRATITLTPLYPAASAAPLAHWPSLMVGWLRLKNFRLKLLVQPVAYAGAANDCLTLPTGAIPFIDVEASAAEPTWKGRGDER